MIKQTFNRIIAAKNPNDYGILLKINLKIVVFVFVVLFAAV